VKDTAIDTTGGLLGRYGVPTASPVPSISTSYTKVTIEGTGPKLANLISMSFKWDLPSVSLWDFGMQFSGAPDYMGKAVLTANTFGQTKPTMTLSGTTVAGLDGEYYVNGTATQMVWVKKDGSYAVIFKL
jgi:hypothetical protein